MIMMTIIFSQENEDVISKPNLVKSQPKKEVKELMGYEIEARKGNISILVSIFFVSILFYH